MASVQKAPCRVGIVGGGIIALCAAYELAARGAGVTVIERDRVGSGASRGNGGQIVPADPLPAPGMVFEGLRHWFSPSSAFYINGRSLLTLTPFLLRFARRANRRDFMRSFRRLDELNQLTVPLFNQLAEAGVGRGFSLSGNLKTFREYDAAVAEWNVTKDLSQHGLMEPPGPFLESSELHELEPSLGDAARWGFLRTDVRWGDPSTFVDDLAAVLAERGVQFVEYSTVTSVGEVNAVARVNCAHGDTHEFDQVLVAAGSDSAAIVPRLQRRGALVAGKGYSFTVRPARMPRFTVLLGEAHVGATPLDKARLRIAGTMEFGARTDEVEPARIAAIARAAAPFLDGVDFDERSEEWAGSRPMTPDGLPYLGRVPGTRSIFVATGHNMLGLSLGPASGRRMAELMRGEISDSALASFALQR